ncbi:MAG TPA: hypothetical protein VHV57_06080 [Acidimicrobiales bacterium]|jgi:hypothetical protein|nr:hypothetical protein [Acidimicrobiales bacterium]
MAGGRSTLIRIGSGLGVLLGSSALLFATATAAGAAGSTPPAATTTPVACSLTVTVTVTSTAVNVPLATPAACDYASGSSVAVTLNGAASESATADNNGVVNLNATVTDPHIAIDTTAPVAVSLGTNTIVATGTTSSGATDTVTFVVDLQNAPGSSGLAFTGADLAALIGAALALVLLGSAIVIFTRRRASQLHDA